MSARILSRDTAPQRKRGRYRLYQYRDLAQHVPRRTEYDVIHPKPKRRKHRLPKPPNQSTVLKPLQQPSTSQDGTDCQLETEENTATVSQSLQNLVSSQHNGTDHYWQEEQTQQSSLRQDPDHFVEHEVSSEVSHVSAVSDSENNETIEDVWELVEDNELEEAGHFIVDYAQEEFFDRHDDCGESEAIDDASTECADSNNLDDDCESEEEECLAEASNLHLKVSDKIKLMLLLATKKRHKLTYRAAESIMHLCSNFSESEETFAPSKHLMKHAIKQYSSCLSEHHICPKCSEYHGLAEKEFECLHCGQIVDVNTNKKEGSCFIYISIGEQTKFMLESGLSEKLVVPEQRTKISFGYEDIYDGKIYKERLQYPESCISFNFFVDGVQVAATSKNAGWPVLLCINELPLDLRRKHIIMACIWVSKKKPNMKQYLKPFIRECNRLLREGILVNINGSIRRIRVIPLMCVSDSVARPLLRNSTQFNGVFGCGLCYHPGFHLKRGRGHARSYSISAREYPLRTHEETMNLARRAEELKERQKGIKGVSILSETEGFDVIECLDLDLFHALVNVAKRFAHMWFNERLKCKPYNVFNKLDEVDRRLLSIKVTDDVSRSPRSLSERSDYRGHEWFHWVVFYSIPVLKEILPSRYLNHWKLLVHAIVILMQNSVAKSEVCYASRFLRKFNIGIDQLYGKPNVTFSCHLLTHLELSVQNFGQPFTHSAFMFENFLAEVKSAIKSANGVAHQIGSYMQLKIALLKMKADLWFQMSEKDKAYLKSVTVYEPLVQPTLVLGSISFLGECVQSKLSPDSYDALTQASIVCDMLSKYPVYLRAAIDNEVFHSTNYTKVCKKDNTVVLLESNDVFQPDLFLVVNNVGLALGHYMIEDSQSICSTPLPHMRLFKSETERVLKCVPISMFDSKLLSFTVSLSTNVIRLGFINVLKQEMLI